MLTNTSLTAEILEVSAGYLLVLKIVLQFLCDQQEGFCYERWRFK